MRTVWGMTVSHELTLFSVHNYIALSLGTFTYFLLFLFILEELTNFTFAITCLISEFLRQCFPISKMNSMR